MSGRWRGGRKLDPHVVERACTGERMPLTTAERRLATARLAIEGLSTGQMARRLGCTKRTVQRHRAAIRKGEVTMPQVLTDLELDTLRAVAEGMTNDEIAALMFASEGTIRRRLNRTYAKLGAHNRAHAVAIGFRTGLLEMS